MRDKISGGYFIPHMYYGYRPQYVTQIMDKSWRNICNPLSKCRKAYKKGALKIHQLLKLETPRKTG